MKFLCLSDMHGSAPDIRKIAEKEKPLAILCSGDSSPHGWTGESGTAEDSLEAMIETGLPVFYCTGNVDDLMVLAMMEELADNFFIVDGKSAEIEDFKIIGMGSFLNHMEEKDLEELIGNSKNLIFLNHRPPKGCLDAEDDWWGGDDAELFRKAIEKHNPLFAVCGHIHEANGSEKLGKSLVVNTATKISIVEIKNGKAECKFY